LAIQPRRYNFWKDRKSGSRISGNTAATAAASTTELESMLLIEQIVCEASNKTGSYRSALGETAQRKEGAW
jgi:hypothetical protein